MPVNMPDSKDLVKAVREFLEDRIQPAFAGQIALHTRIAVNILKTVEREIGLGPDLDQRELARLKNILGQDGGLAELNAELCRRIREREISYADKDLLQHLWETTLGKMSIDNPGYSAYQRAVETKEV